MKFIVLSLSILFLYGFGSPYSLYKFKKVLDESKLQAPSSPYNSLYSIKYGKFLNAYNKYFYLQDRKYMVFFIFVKSNRSELRFKKDWKVNTKEPVSLEAKVKLFPLNQKKEFTFLQIHADSTLPDSINKPLLRIVWKKELHNIYNHLWAIIRLNDKKKGKYLKYNLMAMPEDFFTVRIRVQNSRLSIWVNNSKRLNDFNVDYWNKYYNYFKVGVYLQGDGCAKALFDKIKIKYEGDK